MTWNHGLIYTNHDMRARSQKKVNVKAKGLASLHRFFVLAKCGLLNRKNEWLQTHACACVISPHDFSKFNGHICNVALN